MWRPVTGEPHRQRGAILVIDDHDDARELVVLALRWAGLFAFGARSVPHALRLMRGVAIDAIVTDYAMPDVDGLALVERLRAEPEYERLPIVMLSGQASEEVRQRVEALGVDYLAKPADVERIVTAVRAALARAA